MSFYFFQLPLKDGRTALILAAYYGKTDVVRLLLERGANTEHADRVGAAWGRRGPGAEKREMLDE